MSRLEFSPQEDPQQQSDPDDSMQVKRSRLGVEDEVAEAQVDSEAHEHRLAYVDRLLKTAPIFKAPLGFADRVISRLKAQTPLPPRYEEGTGIVVGLSVAALISIPVFATVIYILLRGVFDSRIRNDVWDGLTDIIGSVWQGLVSLPTDYPVLFVILVTLLTINLIFSGYVVWFWRGLLRSAKKLR